MRRLSTLALAGLFGGLLLVGDASACHKKKCACPPPAPVCAPAPVVCAPAPKKTCHMKMPKLPKMGCHKKAACAPVAYAPSYAPTYAPPMMATPQTSHQGM